MSLLPYTLPADVTLDQRAGPAAVAAAGGGARTLNATHAWLLHLGTLYHWHSRGHR